MALVACVYVRELMPPFDVLLLASFLSPDLFPIIAQQYPRTCFDASCDWCTNRHAHSSSHQCHTRIPITTSSAFGMPPSRRVRWAVASKLCRNVTPT